MDSRRASRNAVASTAQTLASAVLMFVFYRQILLAIGAEGLGVWSVILASTGAVRIGELGLTGSAIKYTASRLARGAGGEAARIVETTVLTVAVLVGTIAVGGYWALDALLPTFIPAGGLDAARGLLPYAVVSFWLAAVAGALQSGLDGCGRIDLRNAIVFGGQVIYVGLGMLWVTSEGLLGLAYAQLVQGAVLVVSCWAFVRRALPETALLPSRWDPALFREMVGYGVQFQALSLLRMLYEPVTKALLSKFGGLEAAGFYEMASLMVTKVRSLVVAAQQALTPEVAALEETHPERVNEVYEKADDLNWYLCIPVFAGVVAAAPVVSHLWIGGYTGAFVVFTALLAAGWFANTLTNPAFYVLLGTGQMGGIVASHVTIGVVNAVAGFLLGQAAGGYGVVGGWALALTAGAAHLLLSLRRDRDVPIRMPREMGPLVWTAAGALGGWGVLLAFRPDSLALALALGALVGAVVAVPVWRLPHRERLLRFLRRALPSD